MIFNKKDITKKGDEALEEWKRHDWQAFGYNFGKALREALDDQQPQEATYKIITKKI